MKRIILTFSIAMPLGMILQSISKIACGSEKDVIISILEIITGACLYYVSYIIAGKLEK